MSKQKFETIAFSDDRLSRISQINEIIEGYQEQGLRLTLRQLYYQLVTRNIVPNVERSYKNLSKLLTDARMAGLVDWEAIEDRIRQPVVPAEWENIEQLVEGALSAFRLPRWADQTSYAELWIEKDALAGVLEPLANEFHVTLMVNRGYSSASAMYDSARKRFAREGRRKEKILLYLGDFDPSGEDMVRDIRDRLTTFLFGEEIDVRKIALTKAQIEEYEPPPNPAKMSDPRAAKFVELNGDESFEVDALPPEVLAQIVRDAFESVVDTEKMDAVKKKEELLKDKLREAAATIEED